MSTDSIVVLREDFPVLRNDPSLVYLDSAATSLKPQVVVDAVTWFLAEGTSAVFRGVHQRGVEATDRFDLARATIARWFSVADDQVVFTRGATDAINLVRRGLRDLKRVVTTSAEHHSNLLPWRDGLECRVMPTDQSGRISAEELDAQLSISPADLVAVSHLGNVFGATQPISALSEVAHQHGALMLVDIAQSAAHLPAGLDDLGADFVVCSGHKMLGPSGIGALIGQPEALERLDPVDWGGSMVESVDSTTCRLQPAPRRWEAGTPAIESVLGWAAAVEYLESFDRQLSLKHLQTLTAFAHQQLAALPGVEVLGELEPADRLGILPLEIDGWEAHAAARSLSQRANICLRSGFHCAEPLHKLLDLQPTLRASFHIYSTREDIDRLTEAVERLTKLKVG